MSGSDNQANVIVERQPDAIPPGNDVEAITAADEAAHEVVRGRCCTSNACRVKTSSPKCKKLAANAMIYVIGKANKILSSLKPY